MSTKMSQKEYLKKYLSGGSDKKKKKKDKKAKNKATTVKIIDDDMHGDNNLDIDEELLLTGEDAPQIVGIIDASGANSESKWKSFGAASKPEQKPEILKNDDNVWGKNATGHIPNHSPARRKSPEKRSKMADLSPVRRTKNMQHPRRNSDQSPPRKRYPNGHESPRRRRPLGHSRRNSDSLSPKRHSQNRIRKNSDQSPPRRRSPVSFTRDADQSPQRKRSPGHMRKNLDQSPPRRRSPGQFARHSDRRNSRHGTDLSPVWIKREKSPDQSPPRRRNNENPFKTPIKVEKLSPENSPRRDRSRFDSNHSPARNQRKRRSESPPPTHKPSAKLTKTLDGKRAGLQDARTLKYETEERRRNEDNMFSKMSSEISGRDAEVQVRQSSSYRRRRKDLEEDPEVQRKNAAHEQQKKELYNRWNKGLKQIEAYKAKMSDEQYEGSKPLARYSNDADLDEMLRQQERHDDPMLAYMRSKKQDQQKASNIPVMPKYKGSFPENRFGIPPGYRWDGVDRSSGYERKWFDVQNQKKALADEAYKYSTEDM